MSEQDTIGRSPANPYVGPRSFEQGETLYGRDYELHQLLDLLIAERIVLLYSPSGAGKTSLIQAGLIAALEKAGFFVLPTVRVGQEMQDRSSNADQATSAPDEPNRYVLSALASFEAGVSPEQRRAPAELLNLTMDDYLSQHPRSEGTLDNIVLIIDQFEEILTTDPANLAAKSAFFAQLGRALRNRNRWLLCSMREDHVAALDPYVRLVPTRLSTTFRLDLLDVAGAREAAIRPASDAGRPFDDTFVEQVLDDLRRVMIQRPDGTTEPILGPYIEPLHLQVVFRRLWEERQTGNGQTDQPATPSGSDVDRALADYYEQEVRAVAERTNVPERSIREWFDQKLITEQDIRNQVRQGAEQSDGLDNRAIRALVDSHLVRSEPRLGATWFELTHDRLIKPIRTSNAAWIEQNLSLLQRQTTVWIREGRPQGMLLRDEALDEAEQWAASHAGELKKDEQEFLERCRQARAARKHETRLNWMLRLLVALLFLFIAFLIGVGWVIVRQERAARVQQLASQAREAPDRFPQKSLLLALEAVRLAQEYGLAQPAAAQSLHATLATIGGIPLLGHVGTVGTVAFQPRGQLLATGGADGTVRLWRADAPEHPTSVLRGHMFEVAALAFSPDGRLLATGGRDGSTRLWRVDAPERPIAVLGQHVLGATALAFSLDGHLLATGDLTGTARLWRVDAPQQPLTSLQSSPARDPKEATSLVFSFSHDGKMFAVGGSDGQLQLLQIAAPREAPKILREGQADRIGVFALVFSPDDSTLAAGISDGTVLLWKSATNQGQLVSLGQDSQHPSERISTLAFSPDGAMLAAGGENGTVWLWRLDALASPPTVLGRQTQRVGALAFSRDGRSLATGSDDGTALVWPIGGSQGDPTTLRGHEGAVRALAFSDDGRSLATGSDDGTARLWPIAAPQSEPTLLRSHTDEVRSVAFSPDNTTLISMGNDGTALRWQVESAVPQGTAVRQGNSPPSTMAASPNNQWLATAGLDDTGTTKIVDIQQLTGPGRHTMIISPELSYPRMVLFSPDSRLLALGGSDGRAHIWQLDALQSAPIVLDSGGLGNVVLAFSPDSQVLATGSDNGIVRLWRTNAQAAPIAELHDKNYPVETMAFGLDGSTLASGSNDGSGESTVRLWNVAQPQSTSTVLLSRDSAISILTFSRDGRMLATGYGDGTVWLWDAAAPQSAPARLPGGHTKGVSAIAFSPDGKLLATGSDDTTAHLWQLDSQNAEPVILRGHQRSILALAFSPDTRYLATGSQDTTVGLWRLQTGDLIGRACAAVGRNLAAQERQAYMLTDNPDDRKTCAALPLHPSVYTAWLLQDQLETALTAYTAEQQRDPTLEPPAAWLVRQGAELLQRGRLEQALALYSRAREIDPQLELVDVSSLNQYCLSGTSERFAEALDACNRAVALAPKKGDYLFNRGLVRRYAGDLAGAIKDLEAFPMVVAGQPNAGTNLPLAQQWIDEMQQELKGSPTPTP